MNAMVQKLRELWDRLITALALAVGLLSFSGAWQMHRLEGPRILVWLFVAFGVCVLAGLWLRSRKAKRPLR